jgi:pyruvate formate lyase activating enzyme
MKGYVSNIQKFSLHDGYGIRTIVFLLGCSLRCKWCQNPETIGTKPELMFLSDACRNCGQCRDVCPVNGPLLKNGDDQAGLAAARCVGCFRCAEACPYGALKVSGKEMDSEEIFKEVMKDLAFYRRTGGGITLSGGEPLLRADFVSEILEPAKKEGLGTCVETAGNVSWANFERILPFTDLFLFDVKFIDPVLHAEWTGSVNGLIQENLKNLALREREVIVRIPLIPGVNDGIEFQRIIDRTAELGMIGEVHILPFHQLGSTKYSQLGIEYSMKGHREDNSDAVKACEAYAASKGFRVSVGGSGFLKRRAE